MADTIPKRLFQQASKLGSRPAYYIKQRGNWKPTSWTTYADEVRAAGRALIGLGLETGQTVAILGFNRPEWTIFDVAAIAVGGAGAGVYTTCSPTEVQYIVDHAESPIMLVEDEAQWRKVEERRANLPHLKHVVTMKDAGEIDDDMVMTWDEFLAKGEDVTDEDFDSRMDAISGDDLATLIYTSGTTGPPKGVMLSHDNLAWTSGAGSKLVEQSPDDKMLSYLPLSHIAEQMFTIHGAITNGGAVYYAESIEKVADNLKEVQPTLFFGVPRIWEKFHAALSDRFAQATGFKKTLLGMTQSVCTKVTAKRNRGESIGMLLGLQYKLVDKLVLSKLKPAIGMGDARMCVSGAAPISKEILEFFGSIDIVVNEVYGQSEDTGPTSFNRAGMVKFGTVGARIPGIDVKIADDGEILVKGPNVFMGYFKDKEATDEVLIDGWLHSGDLGAFDHDGFLSITGRKKDIIITAGGKNVAPKNIEAALKNTRLINEAVVIGDRRKFLSCLITIDEEALETFAKETGIDVAKYSDDALLESEIQAVVDEVNKDLAKVETIKKFTILPRNFTIDDGELTPTLKVKRNKVNTIWADTIESMYGDSSGAAKAAAT